MTSVILYFILYILYFKNSILSRSTIYVILTTHEEFPEDDVLTSKHVAANHMQLYVIKVLILCSSWSKYKFYIKYCNAKISEELTLDILSVL